MPALDYCHPQIVHALEKDGWTVTSELRVRAGRRAVYIDALASRPANGSNQQIFLAEIKCFPDPDSTTRDLYIGIGQYLVYRAVLAEVGDSTPLYLAIPMRIFDTIFDAPVLRAMRENSIRLLIVDLNTETINQWIES